MMIPIEGFGMREIRAPSWISLRVPYKGSKLLSRGAFSNIPVVKQTESQVPEDLESVPLIPSFVDPASLLDLSSAFHPFVIKEAAKIGAERTLPVPQWDSSSLSVNGVDSKRKDTKMKDSMEDVDDAPEISALPGESSSIRLQALQQRARTMVKNTQMLLQEVGATPSEDALAFANANANQTWAISQKADLSHFEALKPHLAMHYPFELDGFQKEAILHMERGESVFVAAHTSAGKTVVAEYAIALAKRHMTRAIYTSPIKTLSNQKYRDFKERFGSVGILTGDVQINATASCLIMTTEILRSMLYRGSDIIKDVEWVIFDEVHYVNDAERGVVWEEVLIMLPPQVKLVLLSATVPNAVEFADWIGRTKKVMVHVISTFRRPVPLEHYLYYQQETYKIVDEKKVFVQTGYRAAVQAYKSAHKDVGKAAAFNPGKPNRPGISKSQWNRLIAKLQSNDQLPAVVFSFSKRKCEEYTDSLRGTDLTTVQEKKTIKNFFQQSISRLHGSDKNLPQLRKIQDLLLNGVGIHHAGLLPLAKEIVEILFSRGLCKVLFATETFAMGVNMPTRTAVFSHIRKHDGREFRYLLPGEYTQMSGRAGRRGLDRVGLVMIFCESEIPEEHVLQKMMLGVPTQLVSQFRLSYNMILNLLRGEGFGVEEMMRKSFSEFDSERDAPVRRALLKQMRTAIKDYEVDIGRFLDEFPNLPETYSMFKDAMALIEQLQNELLPSRHAASIMQTGRIVIVQHPQTRMLAPAFVVRSLSDTSQNRFAFRVFMLKLNKIVSPMECILHSSAFVPFDSSLLEGSVEFIDVMPSNIVFVAKSKVSVTDLPMGSSANPAQVKKALDLLTESWKKMHRYEVYDLVNELRIRELDIVDRSQRLEILVRAILASPHVGCPSFVEAFEKFDLYARLDQQRQDLEVSLLDDNLAHMPDFANRVRVLQSLGFLTELKTVTLKGKVSCELNSCNCILVSELIFQNFLTPLAPEEIVCVLSAFLAQEKSGEEGELTDFMKSSKAMLISLALKLGELQQEKGLEIAPSDFVKSVLNFSMMQIAYEWARGMPFSEICTLTEIQEGSIVRTILQLEQACREVRDAARVIGDLVLFDKMQQCSVKIKRDIVFAASLYVQ
eukprot:ANDGO_05224.mRNA.1 Putative ATP-dependent RNA helicase C550.03c